MSKKTVVKIKEITSVHFDNTIKTKDTRYNSKKSIKKIVNYCLKNGFSFKVGIKDNIIIRNKNYIEIFDDWFLFSLNDKSENCNMYEKGRELRKWLKNE